MIKKNRYDAVVIGAGIMGCTTALHLAKSGMSTLIIDKGKICREASGVNAGTLTIHMTRAQLIPFAIKGWELWMNTNKWLGEDIEIVKTPGLCLAFTEADEELLVQRSKERIKQGASIKLISKKEAFEQAMNDVPLRKMSQPDEIAQFIAFLISNAQTSITGQTLDINNGAMMP